MARITCVSHTHGAMHARTDAHTPTHGVDTIRPGKGLGLGGKVFEEVLPKGNVKFCHVDSIV